jgi:hypothetical protein
VIGTAAAALLGSYLVLALLGCGLVELWVGRRPAQLTPLGVLFPGSVAIGGVGALAWTAFKSVRCRSAEGS